MTWRFVTLVNGAKGKPVTVQDGQEYLLPDEGRFVSSAVCPREYTMYPTKASLVQPGIFQEDSGEKVVHGQDSLLVNTFRFDPIRIFATLGFYYDEGSTPAQIKRKEIELRIAYRFRMKER